MNILSLGEKIKELRKVKGISLQELGGNFVSKAQLSYVENNKSSPSIELLAYLAKKLDVDLEYLLETEKQQAIRHCEVLIETINLNLKLNKTQENLEIFKKIEKLSNEYFLNNIIGKASLLIAQGYIDSKDYDEAIEYVEKGLYYFIKCDYKEEIARGYIKAGNIYMFRSLFEVALQKYRQAYSFYNSMDSINLELESDILFNISNCYRKLEQGDKAVEYAREVCKIDKQLKEGNRYAQSLLTYSASCIRKKDYDAAKEALEKANKILDEKKDKASKAFIENNFGCIFLSYKEYDKAFYHLNKAKEIKLELGLAELPSTLFELYNYYIEIGKEEEAINNLEEGLKFSYNKDLKNYIIDGLNLYVLYYLEKNRHDRAIERLLELSNILKDLKMNKKLISIYLKLGNAYYNLGHYEESQKYYNEAYRVDQIN